MASSVTTGKKVVLRLEDKLSYTFNNVDPAASNASIYALGNALNAFQASKPPLKILAVTTRQIVS